MKAIAHFLLFWMGLAILPHFSFSQSPFSGLPFVRNFHTRDYKGGIQNWSIAQDSRGIMYIANNFGLLEYDGNRWEIYEITNGSKMRSVAVDESGKIFVGCQGDFGYFFPDQQGKLAFTSLADSLPAAFRNFDETWNLFLDDGKVYFCTFSNIFIYENNSFSVVQPAHPLELSFFVNRKLLVHERGRGLTKLVGDSLHLIPGGSFFERKNVSAILPSYDNELLISTFQQGIYLMKQTGEIRPWNPKQQSFFQEAIINCMVRLKNGNYAVGTQNVGVLILDSKGEVIRQLTSGRGLENRTVLSIMEDDLQNLWIGSNNGLAYAELGSPFTVINEEVGLPGTGYAAYMDDNTLYLGTNTGLYLKHAQHNESFKLIEGTRGQVYHIGKYDNELLMGHHTGAYRIESEKAELISAEQGSWIFEPVPEVPNKLIGGVYNGIQFYDKVNNQWNFSSKPSNFKESSRVMEFDAEGMLWITHGYKGVFKLDLDAANEAIRSVSFYGADKGFPTNVLINVYPIRNELIFTSEHGVFKYDKKADRFVRDPLFTDLLGGDAQLWSIREDALGNIYFIGNNLIGVMRKNAMGTYDLDLNSFSKIKSFLNDDLENIVILKNNEVLFGAKEGFIHYDPDIRISRKPNLQTHIRSFSTTAEGDSVLFYGNFTQQGKVTFRQSAKDIIKLPYKLNSVNFMYAATSFESDGEVWYQYYLEKFDKGWSDWSYMSQKEYTNLHEGEYEFHVRARNVYGEISKEAIYRFVIQPPWYRTAWAYVGYSIGTLAFLFTGFGLMERKHKHEKKTMEVNQRQALIRKDMEMELLAQRNQEEITRLQNEKLESDIRHMNKELGTSTMLILNKNEFISKVKDNLKTIANKSADEEAARELSRIVHDIEGNLSSDEDWEHFQVHFDKVHGDFSKRFKDAFPSLSPQDMKLSAYLRMNLSTKEIANLLNISVRGVEISRYRLRKKLNLNRNLNLQEFILKF